MNRAWNWPTDIVERQIAERAACRLGSGRASPSAEDSPLPTSPVHRWSPGQKNVTKPIADFEDLFPQMSPWHTQAKVEYSLPLSSKNK